MDYFFPYLKSPKIVLLFYSSLGNIWVTSQKWRPFNVSTGESDERWPY